MLETNVSFRGTAETALAGLRWHGVTSRAATAQTILRVFAHEGRLDRSIYASNQRCFLEWLVQKPDRSVIERTSSVLLIRIGGNQNYWCAISLRADCFLQFKTV